jgi:mono/diheme cytochrome c family protein
LFRSRGAQAIIPTVLTVAVSGLALTLIVAVIARSPYTHGNLSPAGYDRTEVVYLGEKLPMQRDAVAKDLRGDPAKQGQALFVGLNCAGCHGLKGQGGVFAPVIIRTDAATLASRTSKGQDGMPSYEGLTDQDLKAVLAYLKSVASKK